MSYDISTRFDYLGTRFKELNQGTLTYQRAGSADVIINNPTPEKLDLEEFTAMGIALVTSTLQGFVFDTSDLAALTPHLPKHGDKVIYSVTGHTYEVMGNGEEIQSYRFTTSSQKRIRIHTKQVTITLPGP